MRAILLTCCLILVSFASFAQDFLPKLDPIKSLQKDTGNFYFKEIWIQSKDVNKDDAGGFLRRAVDKMDFGYYKEAYNDINKSISIDSTIGYSYFLKGVINLKYDSVTTALSDFKKSIALNDTNLYCFLYSAQIYASMGKIFVADSLYHRALSINNKFHEAYFGLGNLYFIKGDLINAEKQYKKTIELKPEFTFAYLNLAIIYVYKNPNQASKYLDKAIKVDPTLSHAYFLRGHLELGMGKKAAALRDWNKTVELDSINNHYRISLAFLYINEKQYKEGIDHLIRLVKTLDTENFVSDLKMSPEVQRTSDFLNQILIYNRYANTLSDFEKEVVLSALCSFYLERYKIAESYYELLLSNPSSASGLIHFLRGFNLEYLNKAAAAVKSYESSIYTNKFPDEVYLRKGIAQFDQAEYQKAISSFSSFIERKHSTRHALRARANAFVRIAKYDSAIIDYTSFIKLDSSQLDIYTARALCFKTMENYGAAITDYSYIVKRDHYDVESVGLLAVCMYLNGDTLGAYNKLNETFNGLRYLSETGYYLRGTINLLKKNYDTAVQDFNKVIILNPQNIDALIYRGLANYSLEHYTLSKSDFQSAIKLDKDEVTALYTLGLVNIKLNDLKGAYENLHKAELLGHPLAKRAINTYLKNYQLQKNT